MQGRRLTCRPPPWATRAAIERSGPPPAMESGGGGHRQAFRALRGLRAKERSTSDYSLWMEAFRGKGVKQLAGPMVCRVNGLAYCLSRISTWQGASPYGVPLGRPVGLLTAAGNSSLPLAMYCHIRCQGETIATQCVALSDSQSLCSLVQLIRPSVEHGVAAQE